MALLPHFPLQFNTSALFGLTVLLGIIGGELAKRFPFIPTVSGYIAIGYLIGPGGLNLVNTQVYTAARLFAEISLSLILFELGRYLDFRWLIRDPNLLKMGLVESLLTFVTIFLSSHYLFGLMPLQSAFAAIIAISTSPAVIMMVARDLAAEGPVTRRTFILTSINNLFALTLFTILKPFAQNNAATTLNNIVFSIYQLTGSTLLGLFIFMLSLCLAFLTGKNKENQFLVLIAVTILAAGLSRMLNLSPMLTLFVLGVAARNFDLKHLLMEIDFAWLARLFFILLFVVIGVTLQLQELRQYIVIVIAFILVRYGAKSLGVWFFAKKCNLTLRQSIALSLALTPMAGIAISLSVMLTDLNFDPNHRLLSIIGGVIALMNIIGPIAVQIAMTNMGEALPEKSDAA